MKKLLAAAALLALVATPALAQSSDDNGSSLGSFFSNSKKSNTEATPDPTKAPRPSIGAPAVAIIPGKPEIRAEQNPSASQTAAIPTAVKATPAASEPPQSGPKIIGGMNVTSGPTSSQNLTSAPVKASSPGGITSAPVTAASSTVRTPHLNSNLHGNITAKPNMMPGE